MKQFVLLSMWVSFTLIQSNIIAQSVDQSFGKQSPYLAQAPQDNTTVIKNLLQLLSGSSTSNYSSSQERQHLPSSAVEEAYPDPTGYALRPLGSSEETTVTAQDIIENNSKVQKVASVCCIDLNEFDFTIASDDRDRIYHFLKNNNLYNVRTINIKNCKGISHFIAEIFGVYSRKDTFVSLFNLSADNSDITLKDFDTIYAHFSDYTYFIRDLQQISARHDAIAALCTVYVGNKGSLNMAGTSWLRGKKTEKNYQILYRSREPIVQGPFIITVNIES